MGYFSATALNYLASGHGNHVQNFYKSHSQRGIYGRPCGSCGECNRAMPKYPVQGQETVDVRCFEPSEVHVESLRKARDTLYGTPGTAVYGSLGQGAGGSSATIFTSPGSDVRTQVNFHVHHEAMSNYTGTADFPANCTVNTCSVGTNTAPAHVSLNHTASNVVKVKLTTVDEEMRKLSWPLLDVLKIDAEGFDPAVLAGAFHSLLVHRIGVLSFHYQRLWTRSGASLRQCVNYLERLGYACFFDAPVLTRISGGCWLELYETWRKSSIVCAVIGSEMDAALVAGSHLTEESCRPGRLGKDRKRVCESGKARRIRTVARRSSRGAQ
ncbi:hypothetical protein Vretifemale_4375 [Volvox reticuliferus]|uniref:Methyltransferase FkbM domain-containing protein n=1 Tax=Volvox reticuliferus TaxID=1737510 RepID=A0A8J4FH49_9CHLO|nr:hypothetical protein Vretifemale_4375 [Volvox reticuliferus]